MATSQQQSQQWAAQHRRAIRRRWAFAACMVFACVFWGPRVFAMLVNGWLTSSQVRKTEGEIERTRRRINALERRVAYVATPEGQDVEAKRQFGVGPAEEVWITVEAEPADEDGDGPRALDDRVHAWLTDAGSRFMDRVRKLGGTVEYWLGLDGVSDVAPAEVGDASAEDAAQAQ